MSETDISREAVERDARYWSDWADDVERANGAGADVANMREMMARVLALRDALDQMEDKYIDMMAQRTAANREKAEAQLEASAAKFRLELAEKAFAPVLDWYQSDEEHLRPLDQRVADAITDLQGDRASLLQAEREKVEAVAAERERIIAQFHDVVDVEHGLRDINLNAGSDGWKTHSYTAERINLTIDAIRSEDTE